MKAKLVSSRGVVEVEVGDTPPLGLKHDGFSFHLLDYDDPTFSGSWATYSDGSLSDDETVRRANGTEMGQQSQ